MMMFDYLFLLRCVCECMNKIFFSIKMIGSERVADGGVYDVMSWWIV